MYFWLVETLSKLFFPAIRSFRTVGVSQRPEPGLIPSVPQLTSLIQTWSCPSSFSNFSLQCFPHNLRGTVKCPQWMSDGRVSIILSASLPLHWPCVCSTRPLNQWERMVPSLSFQVGRALTKGYFNTDEWTDYLVHCLVCKTFENIVILHIYFTSWHPRQQTVETLLELPEPSSFFKVTNSSLRKIHP